MRHALLRHVDDSRHGGFASSNVDDGLRVFSGTVMLTIRVKRRATPAITGFIQGDADPVFDACVVGPAMENGNRCRLLMPGGLNFGRDRDALASACRDHLAKMGFPDTPVEFK